MKLIIQIPCYNEEKSLPITLKSLPREVKGFDSVEWLVIDDGSSDNTSAVAKANGVDNIIRFTKNQGLAKGFMAGLDKCLELGADVIVNTDADNQYNADDIPNLVRPILEKRADIVIGTRPISQMKHFSTIKKILQYMGSWIIQIASNARINDAPSGFRALSRDAALKLNVFNEYTYTLETIMQAGLKNMAIVSIPIRINEDLRPSRLVKSIADYVKKSILTIIRILVTYKPFKFFMTIGITLFTIGFLIGVRFLVFYLSGQGQGHIQSLIMASILLGIGFQTMLIAFVADLLAVNRKLLEELQYLARKKEIKGNREENED
jgi:glycosyltransferase involved in cell wall biosynthesis